MVGLKTRSVLLHAWEMKQGLKMMVKFGGWSGWLNIPEICAQYGVVRHSCFRSLQALRKVHKSLSHPLFFPLCATMFGSAALISVVDKLHGGLKALLTRCMRLGARRRGSTKPPAVPR